ncbi:RNA polymerase II-associated protein 3-like isoform X2 [Bacillus rossius redtenbacheri]|uniref:RNA polymerase II-associated protein 3-like isoform X2 n=1 Tax=Bacillus rossius redtenbacheri TaxID=93214 RepID=UPI002FDEFBB2
MDPFTIQNQIRNNAEELQDYLKDLSLWNKEMKRKEADLEDRPSYSKVQEVPPVRSKRKKVKQGVESGSKQSNQRISGLDYSSWEKFDVEKACEMVDVDSSQSESELEVPAQVQYRLMEEASFEKEKGNQFVKSQKWDDAIKCYTRAIKCYPHDAIFYANRALCYLKTKNFKAAETDCTSALRLDDTYVKAYQRRAAARTELSQPLEAAGDLRKVLELEPKNSASRQELARLEKNSLKQKAARPVPQEPRSKSSVESLPGPSGLCGIKTAAMKQVKCSTNQGIVEKIKNVADDSGKEGNQAVVVRPIKKPPHLRSKKPLRRIQIEEIDSSSSSIPAGSRGTDSAVPPARESREPNISEGPSSSRTEVAPEERPSSPVHAPRPELPDHPHPADGARGGAGGDTRTQVPSAPVSSVQFLVGWNKVKESSQHMHSYLKQINGADLPKLFQDSLESNILSGILTTLANEFTKAGSPVYSYLLGLSNVRRFSTLSLFLSKEEKERIRKLLDYCLGRGECSEGEASVLREKYEL